LFIKCSNSSVRYYKHYKLYQYLFTKKPVLDFSVKQNAIETAPLIPPLAEANPAGSKAPTIIVTETPQNSTASVPSVAISPDPPIGIESIQEPQHKETQLKDPQHKESQLKESHQNKESQLKEPQHKELQRKEPEHKELQHKQPEDPPSLLKVSNVTIIEPTLCSQKQLLKLHQWKAQHQR
jgi:hypothetical protein